MVYTTPTQRTTRKSLQTLVTALVLVLGLVPSILAQPLEPAAELLTVVGNWEGPDKLQNKAAVEGLAVEIRSDLLSRETPRLRFQAFDGRVYEANLERLDRPATGVSVWIGRVEGYGEHSKVVLAQASGFVSGYLDTPEARYEISPRRGGHVMIQLDSSRFGGCRIEEGWEEDHSHPVPGDVFADAAQKLGLDPAALWERAEKADKSVASIQVLVLATSTVVDALGGTEAIAAYSSSLVATLDDALVSSGIQADIRGGAWGWVDAEGLGDSSGGSDGLVNVLYSNTSGLTNNDHMWHQARADLGKAAWSGDTYGKALAVGDFDKDGRDDLAIGIPGEDIDGKTDTGAVQVLYGGSSKLTNTGFDYFHQGAPGVLRNDEHGDEFGASLAVGDFDGDGYDDLAIGRPGEHIGSVSKAGAINVLYGASGGITTSGDQAFQQENVGLTNQDQDNFGEALAAGDFNGDGYDDLAIGIPGNIGGIGKVTVMFGTSSGLSTVGVEHLDQESPFFQASREAGDRFGTALAVGDFNGDAYDDLAVGAPYEGLRGTTKAGHLHVFFGDSSGFAGSPHWPQTFNQTAVGGSIESGDHFGMALAAGDFDGDGRDDLVVGAPYEDSNDIGRVHFLWGGSSRLSGDGSSLAGSDGSHMGRSLTTGDFNGDGYDDVAIGRPWADDSGDVAIYHGRASGIPSAAGTWDQDSGGIQGESETGDQFGYALAAGDFNGDGESDLAVGAPGEAVSNEVDRFKNWLQWSDAVATIRDHFSIDLVGLIVENIEDSLCGSAQGVLGNTGGDSTLFFQVTRRSCAVGNLTFAHEIGHLMGLAHDPANAGSSGACSDARGHYVSGEGRTLMSYNNQCSNNDCPRVALISNPDVDFSFGDASGILGSRDNARCADLTAGNVANYRN